MAEEFVEPLLNKDYAERERKLRGSLVFAFPFLRVSSWFSQNKMEKFAVASWIRPRAQTATNKQQTSKNLMKKTETRRA